MSVINQVLIDLEKRRASGAERSVLPNHVRALPDDRRSPNWGWIGAGGLAAAVALLASWTVLTGIDLGGMRGAAPTAPRRGAEIAIEKVVSASAGVKTRASTAAESGGTYSPAQSLRLSLELSSPPVVEPIAAHRLVPTARVVGKADGVATAAIESRAKPAERRTPRSPGVANAGQSDATPSIKKQVREPTPREIAENDYRKAAVLLHQQRYAEAQEGFQAVLNQYPGHHAARQALAGLLLDGKRYAEAEQVLQDGLDLAPAQIGFGMTLARLQVNRDDTRAAIGTLRVGLGHAKHSADYLAFLAALLQRQGEHAEAVEHFQAALRIRPTAGVWWLGLGISLQATGRNANAQDAYRRARAGNNLNPELAAFAEQRLRALQ